MATSGSSREARTRLRRQRIIETAERLFAERGVEAVSLNEINKAAGQKNTSALHYHFGSREELLTAVIDGHVDEIRRDVAARLDRLESKGGSPLSAKDFVAVCLPPYAAKLGDERGVRYLQISAQLLAVDPAIASLPRDTKATVDLRMRLLNSLAASRSFSSQREVNRRMLAFGILMFTSLAAYSRLDESTARKMYGSRATFVRGLSEMLEALLDVS